MTYVIGQGFSREVEGPYNVNSATETGLGVGVLLPSSPNGLQLDAFLCGFDSGGTNFIRRLTVLSGGIAAEGLVALVNAFPVTFAQYLDAGAPTDYRALALRAQDAAGGLTVRADLYGAASVDSYLQAFPARPGGGLIIPPGENAIVLLTAVIDSTYVPAPDPPTNIPFCTLTVLGAPLPAAVQSLDVPLAAGPARSGNVVIPGTLPR